MPRGLRAAFVLGPVAAAALIAFLVLQRGDDEAESAAAPTTQAAATTAATAESAGAPTVETATTETEDETSAETTTEPAPISIRVENGQAIGGPAEIDVRKNDVVRFVVTSDVDDEVHVHGYDISKSVGPGQRASFRFEAEIEGIFEIELEGRAIEIATLVVQPR